jgi:hypothetical protein
MSSKYTEEELFRVFIAQQIMDMSCLLEEFDGMSLKEVAKESYDLIDQLEDLAGFILSEVNDSDIDAYSERIEEAERVWGARFAAKQTPMA